MEADYEYFQRRADEEQAAAEAASAPEARQAHLELATRHAEMANALKRERLKLKL